MTIKVTQEDISSGLKASPYACPVALAVARATGRCPVIRCADMWLDRHYLWLPQVVADFIATFDDNLPVAPFEFDLPL